MGPEWVGPLLSATTESLQKMSSLFACAFFLFFVFALSSSRQASAQPVSIDACLCLSVLLLAQRLVSAHQCSSV